MKILRKFVNYSIAFECMQKEIRFEGAYFTLSRQILKVVKKSIFFILESIIILCCGYYLYIFMMFIMV